MMSEKRAGVCLAVVLTIASALLACGNGPTSATTIRQGASAERPASNTMELLYMSSQGEWRIGETGTIVFTDTRGRVSESVLQEGIIDAMMADTSSLAVLSPAGLYWLEPGHEDVRPVLLCSLDLKDQWTRIVAANKERLVWLQSKKGISMIKQGRIESTTSVCELVAGLHMSPSSIDRGYLPILEADNLSGTAFILLRNAEMGAKIMVFDPSSQSWRAIGTMDETIAAPLVATGDSLLLLDGSGKRLPIPDGIVFKGPTVSGRNRFARDPNGNFIARVWKLSVAGGTSMLLRIDGQRGGVIDVLCSDLKSNVCVYCANSKCWEWLPDWQRRQTPSILRSGYGN